MIINLSKPTTFDGVEHSTLELNFDALTGKDLINATKETKALGDQSPVLEFSKTYQAVIAARAANVQVDLILALKAQDFTVITLNVQNFLLQGGSPETSTESSETSQ